MGPRVWALVRVQWADEQTGFQARAQRWRACVLFVTGEQWMLGADIAAALAHLCLIGQHEDSCTGCFAYCALE